jgi:hypothetical protein
MTSEVNESEREISIWNYKSYMPLEPPDKNFFEAACGYIALEMPLEANEELEKIDSFNRAAAEVLALLPGF